MGDSCDTAYPKHAKWVRGTLGTEAFQEPSSNRSGPGRNHEATGAILRTKSMRDGLAAEALQDPSSSR